METIVEEDSSNTSSPSSTAFDSLTNMTRDSESEANSSVFVPQDNPRNKTMSVLDLDSDGCDAISDNSSQDEDIYIPPSSPTDTATTDASADSEENDVIEERLTEISHGDEGDNSDIGARDKKYDLGGKYDLGASVPDKEKKYDLGAFLTTAKVSKRHRVSSPPRDSQSQSTKTQHRSGSSVYILHKWVTNRDWKAARAYLNSADQNHKRLQASVSYKNDDGETSLHIACRKRAPYDIVKAIIDIGGTDVVMTADTYGGSLPLHHACHFNASVDVIKLLVYVGGSESLNHKDAIGNLPLHWALSKNVSSEIIKLLIDIGGQKTIASVNKIGWNSLHAATFFSSSRYMVVKLLIDTGGPSIVKHVNKKGETPLDILYEKNPYDAESIRLMQDQLGTDPSLMTWLPRGTVERTMNWIKRQPLSIHGNGFYNSPFVQMILNDSFLDFRFLCIILLDLVAQITLVATLSFGIQVENWFGDQEISFSFLNLLIYSTVWLGMRCVTEMFATPIRAWVSELSNWMNTLQLCIVIWSIFILDNRGIRNETDAVVSVLTLGVVWFRLMFVLGDLFYGMAVFAASLQRIAMALASFLVTCIVTLCAFAHMLYLATKWDERYCLGGTKSIDACLIPSLTDSYYSTFTEFLNPASLFLDESYLRANNFRFVLTLCFAVLVQLLLLNVLIAVIIDAMRESKNRGKQAFWTKRFYYITELSNLYRALGCCKVDMSNGNKSHANFEDAKQIHLIRFAFSTAHYDAFPGDFYNFRKWWLKDDPAPDFIPRMRYFLTWSSLDEILIPGPSFERVLSGGKKDSSSHLARICLYILFPIIVIINVLCFVLGLVTFGFLWPKWMKAFLFNGKVDFKSVYDEQVLINRHMDLMKNEVKSIHNAVKAEKFIVKSLEDDMKIIRADLRVATALLKRSDDSYYSEEISEIMSDSSSEMLGA
jgi:hypothetical protein